jgi:hypothetical protein
MGTASLHAAARVRARYRFGRRFARNRRFCREDRAGKGGWGRHQRCQKSLHPRSDLAVPTAMLLARSTARSPAVSPSSGSKPSASSGRPWHDVHEKLVPGSSGQTVSLTNPNTSTRGQTSPWGGGELNNMHMHE